MCYCMLFHWALSFFFSVLDIFDVFFVFGYIIQVVLFLFFLSPFLLLCCLIFFVCSCHASLCHSSTFLLAVRVYDERSVGDRGLSIIIGFIT